jgi:hypothetical protein
MEALAVVVGQDEQDAFAAHVLGGAAAEPGSSARDDRDFSFQVEIHEGG